MFSKSSLMDLETEFKKSLIYFVYEKINEKINGKNITLYSFNDYHYSDKNKVNSLNEEDYCNEIQKYMESDTEFKNDLIKKAKELIEIDKDAQVDSKSLIDKMFRENRIDKNSIDIVSCLLNYIKEKIFNHYLQYIFGVLEHNNFLTTLMEINKDKSINLDKNIIKILKSEFLKAIKVDDEKYEPKFLFNYKIPGFYNFYKNLSEYINKNISIDFYNNEKNLREYFGTKPEKIKNDFHDKEDSLLNLVFDKISQDKLYFDIINKISPYLILNDYITFYLDKYIGDYSKTTNKIIEL